MANRDQNWGFGGPRGEDRWRRDEDRRREGGRGQESRSFGGESRFGDDQDRRGGGYRGGRPEGGQPWRGEARYGSRYDQDRVGYGGQEYGVEGGRDHRTTSERDRAWRGDERETWRPGGGAPYGDLELNPRNRGIQEFGAPHDYAYHPQAGHEFDPDYLHWREEQMRNHDRDYHEWRSSQQQGYDEDYRRFRSERREHFGRTFQDWRSQRSPVGGVPDMSAAGGVSGYGSKTGTPTGYNANAGAKPSGMIEPSHAMNASPGAGQSGGQAQAGGQSGGSSGGDGSPEFGKEPAQVQATANGWDARGSAREHADDNARKDDDQAKPD